MSITGLLSLPFIVEQNIRAFQTLTFHNLYFTMGSGAYKPVNQDETETVIESQATVWRTSRSIVSLLSVFKVSLGILGLLILGSLWTLKSLREKSPSLLLPESFFPDSMIFPFTKWTVYANVGSSNGVYQVHQG